VGEMLGPFQVNLTFAEILASKARKLVVVKVVMFFAVKSVRGRNLINDARSDLDLLERLPKQRNARSVTVAVVDILLFEWADRIDETAEMSPITDNAHCRGRGEWNVDRDFRVVAHAAAGQEVHASLCRALHAPKHRLVRDVADRAPNRPGAEQRALRATQRLNAVQIEEVEVRRE